MRKFIISSLVLARQLNKVAKCVSRHSSILPILESVHFSAVGNVLTITGTNLETCITVKTEAEISKGGRFGFCVDAAQFLKFFSIIDEQPVTIGYDEKKKECHIEGYEFKAKLYAESEGSFPKSPILPEEAIHFSTNAKELMQNFSRAIKYCSYDSLRPAMTGCYLHDAGDDGLMLVATDAHRLFFKCISKEVPQAFKNKKAIIPASAVKYIVSLFAASENIDIALEGNHIFFSGGYNSLVVRHIDARFPDYNVVMVRPDTHLFVQRKYIKKMLAAALCFTNMSTNQVSFTATSQKLYVEGKDVDFENGIEFNVPVYECNKSNLDTKVSFNAAFLIDACNTYKDDFYLKIATMEHADKAVIIDDCILLMPLKINQ